MRTVIYNWYDDMQKNLRSTLVELGSGRRAFTSPTTPKLKPMSPAINAAHHDGHSISRY